MNSKALFPDIVVLGIFVLVLSVSHATADENWPQWRGPGSNGTAAAGDYPTKFSDTENVTWKVTLPGIGCSTPAVWGNSIFLTCGIDGKDAACGYDWSGKELWRVRFGPERPGKHRNGSGSNPSPVTDGEHIYVYFKSGTVACLDFDGKVLWKLNLQEKYGKDTLWWDLGTSPVLAAGNVVIAVMHEGDSYLVALDGDSGDVAWKQPRNFVCKTESDQSYTTPIVLNNEQGQHIITWGADHLTAHDAATGKVLWTCGGFNPEDKAMWRVIASPAIHAGVAVVPYGRAQFLAGVRIGGSGDVTTSNRLWEKKGLGADVPTPVARQGKVFLLTDRGQLVCLHIQTGEQLWSVDLPRGRGKYYASPVLAGDLIYCTRDDGMIFVGKLGDKFKLLAENDMQEPIVATPVPIRGSLLVRGREHLFKIAQ